MISIFPRRAAELRVPADDLPPSDFTVTQDGRPVGTAAYDGRWRWDTADATNGGVLLPKVPRSRLAEYRTALGLPVDGNEAEVVARTWCRTPGNRMEMVPSPAVWAPVHVPLRMVHGVVEGSALVLTRDEGLHPNGYVAASGPRSLRVLLDMLGTESVRATAVNHDRHPATRPARWMARLL